MRLQQYRMTMAAGAAVVAGVGIAWLSHYEPDLRAAGQAASQPAEARGNPAAANAEEREIRKVDAAYLAALNSGDINAIMVFWAPDADFIDESGKMTVGKEAIAALFRKSLPEFKDSKVTGKVESIRFLRPEVALQNGTFDYTTADGSKESSRYAVIWTKYGDKWLISIVRDLPSQSVDLPSQAYAQLKPLEWLVGNWVEDGAKKEESIKVHWAMNKAFLILEYTIKQESGDPLYVTMRIGWDGLNGRVRSWVFDSEGGFGEGYWHREGRKWVVSTSGILPDGETGGATNVYEFVDHDTFVWRAVDREVNDQPLADAEIKFVRQPAKK